MIHKNVDEDKYLLLMNFPKEEYYMDIIRFAVIHWSDIDDEAEQGKDERKNIQYTN